MDEAFFRSAYEADAKNRERQTWPQYWGWVKAFYEGRRFPPLSGWDARMGEVAARVRSPAREEILARLEDVGRRIAAEWAKDNVGRKLSTTDLQGYGSILTGGAKADTGDGTEIGRAIDAVDGEVKRKLA